MRTTARRLLTLFGLGLISLAMADQIALYVLLDEGEFLGRRIAPFDPPLFAQSQRDALARIDAHLETGTPALDQFRIDADLGWTNYPDTGGGEFRYDWAGCRIAGAPLAREKRAGVRRVLTVGCSMTHGDEADANDTWVALLGDEPEALEIGNLGVAGYGLDQALLRLRRAGGELEADEVWLGLLPAAALRVTTVCRALLRHWEQGVYFKPRFRLGAAGELVLVPNPGSDLARTSSFFHSQAEFLAVTRDDDWWVGRAPLAYAPRGSSVLHHSFLGRMGLTLHERMGRDLESMLRDEEGELFALVRAIILATAAETESLGARFRLLVLPGQADLVSAEAGDPHWRALMASLEREGVEVCDVSNALLEAAREEAAGLFQPGGHYSPRGNAVVAEALRAMVMP